MESFINSSNVDVRSEEYMTMKSSLALPIIWMLLLTLFTQLLKDQMDQDKVSLLVTGKLIFGRRPLKCVECTPVISQVKPPVAELLIAWRQSEVDQLGRVGITTCLIPAFKAVLLPAYGIASATFFNYPDILVTSCLWASHMVQLCWSSGLDLLNTYHLRDVFMKRLYNWDQRLAISILRPKCKRCLFEDAQSSFFQY